MLIFEHIFFPVAKRAREKPRWFQGCNARVKFVLKHHSILQLCSAHFPPSGERISSTESGKKEISSAEICTVRKFHPKTNTGCKTFLAVVRRVYDPPNLHEKFQQRAGGGRSSLGYRASMQMQHQRGGACVFFRRARWK
jgi:hypothetical protein